MKHYRTTAHAKYDLKIHIVFIPKYQKRALYGAVENKVRDLIGQICTEMDVQIISGTVAPDHIHLFVSYPPYLLVSDLVQKIKGKSSYTLFCSFPDLKRTFWGKRFWGRGYLVVSSGTITDEIVQQYIENQEGEEMQHGDIAVG